MGSNNNQPTDINAKRAQKFFDQRVQHAQAKGKKSIDFFALQDGFKGYERAMKKKEQGHVTAPVTASNAALPSIGGNTSSAPAENTPA